MDLEELHDFIHCACTLYGNLIAIHRLVLAYFISRFTAQGTLNPRKSP